MRKIRLFDIVNPVSFFALLYTFYFLLILILNFFSNLIFEQNLTLFKISGKTELIAISYLLVFLFSANVLTPFIFNYKPKLPVSFPSNDLNLVRVWSCVIVLMLLGIIVHVFYFMKIGFIPILHDNAAIVRATAKKGFGGFLLLATASFYSCFIILAVVLGRLGKFKRFLVYLLLTVAVSLIIGVGFRGPAAYLVLVFYVVRLLDNPKFINTNTLSKKFILSGVLAVFLLGIVDVIRHGNEVTLHSFLQPLWMISVSVYNLENIVSYFSVEPFWLGKSFLTDLMVTIPGIKSEFMGVKLVSMLGLSFKGEGMTVTAPGEGFLNFGYVGVVLHALIVGVLSELIYKRYRARNTESAACFLVFFSFSISKIAVAGVFPTLIFTIVPVLIFLVPCVFYCRVNKGGV